MEPVGAGFIPEWIVALSGGGREASWLLLDTREGAITDFVQQGRPEVQVQEEESSPAEDEEYWRRYRTRPVVVFLEDWKEKYRNLEWVALPDEYFDGVRERMDQETDVSSSSALFEPSPLRSIWVIV